MATEYELWHYLSGDCVAKHRLFACGYTATEADNIKAKLDKSIMISELAAMHTKGTPMPRETVIYKRLPHEETYHLVVNGKVTRTRYDVTEINRLYQYYINVFAKLPYPAKIERKMEQSRHLRRTTMDGDFMFDNMPAAADMQNGEDNSFNDSDNDSVHDDTSDEDSVDEDSVNEDGVNEDGVDEDVPAESDDMLIARIMRTIDFDAEMQKIIAVLHSDT